MSWLTDAHYEWHAVHGRDALCPLDCFDPVYEPEPEEGEGIRCGHCKGRHWTVEDVRTCSSRA